VTAADPATEPVAPERVPPAVARAVWVMYAGAGLSVAGIGVNIMTLGVIRRRIGLMTPALLASAQHQAIAGFIVGGLVAAAVWAFIGTSCRAGMSWAPVAGTVLFAVGTVYAADVTLGLSGQDAPAAVRAYAAVVWLAGLAATTLLWQRESSRFFRAGRRRPLRGRGPTRPRRPR
jgi:hypothetical protein